MRRLRSLALLVALSGLTACAHNEPRVDSDESHKLKILFHDTQSFFSQYGNYLNMEVPEWQLEVVTDNPIYRTNDPLEEALIRLVNEEQPDILFLDQNRMKILREHNLLLPLMNRFDASFLEVLPVGVQEAMMKDENGDFYGVPQSFTGEVLYYNKSLLAQQGISMPDKLTWKEYALLLQRFPAGEPFGAYLQGSSPSSLFAKVGRSEGLAYWSPDRSRMTLNTEGWKDVVRTIKPLYGKRVIDNTFNNIFDSDSFMQGKAATTINSDDYYGRLEAAKVPFDWGVMPVPTQEAGQTPINVMQYVAINKQTANPKEAVRFIRTLFEPKLVSIFEKNDSHQIASMDSSVGRDGSHPLHFLYVDHADRHDLEAAERQDGLSESFIRDFYTYLSDRLDDILFGGEEPDKVFADIEEHGNRLLEQEKLDRDASDQPESASSAQ